MGKPLDPAIDDTNGYISSIQIKDIPEEWQKYSTALNQFGNEVDFFKGNPNLHLPLENNVIEQSYGSENASWKHKKDRKDLKRKSNRSKHSHVATKRCTSQVADSFSEQDNGMEYCSPSTDFIVVTSRNFEHTLRPRNELHPLSYTGASDTKTDNIPSVQETLVATDEVGSTDMSISTVLTEGNRGCGGNDSDDENKFRRTIPEDSLPQPKFCVTQYERQLQMFNDLLRTTMNWLDQRRDERKNMLEHIEHAYECPAIYGEEPYCSISTNCSQTKDFFDKQKQNITTGNSSKLGCNATEDVLFHHSMNCKKGAECNVPLCDELAKCVREEISQVVDYDHSFVDMNAPEVLLSNTSEFEQNRNVKPRVTSNQLRFNFEVQIGKGGFGKVYKSWVCANKSEALMAVKKMKFNQQQENPEVEQLVRYLKEIGKGPNLLTPDLVISTESRDLTYMVMERGVICLSQYLKKVYKVHEETCSQERHVGICNSGLKAEVVTLYIRQVFVALSYLHERGFVHSDIKADNVMIMPGFKEVKIIDFDFLKKEETKKQCGTPGYAAYEILEKDVGNSVKASDIFAASILIPEMYYGMDMNYGSICNKQKYIKFLKERSNAMYKRLYRHNKPLAQLFLHGSYEDPNKRASASSMLRCFRDNKAIRDMCQANVHIPPLDHVLVGDSTIQNDSDDAESENSDLKAARRIIKKWINKEMEALPSRLPPSTPDQRTPAVLYDSTWLSENRTIEAVNNTVDIDIETILVGKKAVEVIEIME